MYSLFSLLTKYSDVFRITIEVPFKATMRHSLCPSTSATVVRVYGLYLKQFIEAKSIRFGEVPECADERQSTRSGYLRERFQMRR